MASSRKFSVFFAMLLSGMLIIHVSAQNEVTWLEDYTTEMVIGTDTYQYGFSTTDGNDCKLEIKESVTDKKGSTEVRSWIFYLSDLDPSALNFKPKGKAIEVTIETGNDQKFISFYEEGEFDGYTDGIKLSMNDVAETRKMLEAVREHIGPCRDTEMSWDGREAAFEWLTGNIGKAVDNGVQWEQQFSGAEKSYLARLNSQSVNPKGEEASFVYLFDLSDINPGSIKLVVSGKSLGVHVPVKEGKDFIEVDKAGVKSYTDDLTIYADDVEVARHMVRALSYLVEITTPDRPGWDDYSSALGFVKENLGEVKTGEETLNHSLSYEGPSGLAELTVTETGSDGVVEATTYAFYLVDMVGKPVLGVGRDGVIVEMETRDDKDFIRKIVDGNITGYTSSMEFHVPGIDAARDIILALESAIENSSEEITDFTSVEQVNGWMEENLVELTRGEEKYEQMLTIDKENGLQIKFERKLTDEGEVTETRYLVYPDDISLEKLKIAVNMGRLNVALETTSDDLIRNFKNGDLQSYTDDVDVYFSDPLVAKNFMAAILYLKDQQSGSVTPEMSRDDAVSFLNLNIPQVEVPGMNHKQGMEIAAGSECNLKFTRVETPDAKESVEYAYEFIAQDIDVKGSKVDVSGNMVKINLVTKGKQKLIKPFENGEVEDFDDDLTIYADDVLVARRILAAMEVLSGSCE